MAEVDTKKLQSVQRNYDSKYWVGMQQFEDTRHTALHIAKLSGKVCGYCEQGEHERHVLDDTIIKEVVIPDLLVYALHLANIYNVDLGKAYLARLVHNMESRGG